MGSIWWEKTVEYLFVKKYVPDDTLLIPLDGRHELASDGFFFNGTKWVLIEFKAKLKDVKSEKKKYKNYEACRRELENDSRHHCFLYGEETEDGKLDVKSCTYFKNNIRIGCVSCIKHYGETPDKFTTYLTKLIGHKIKSTELKETLDYSMVMGVTSVKDGYEIKTTMRVNDYLQLVKAKLLAQLNKETSDDKRREIMQKISDIDDLAESQGDSVAKFFDTIE